MTAPTDDPGELLMAALREKARGMSDDEWRLFQAQTRPPDYSSFADPADRSRALMSSIAAKSAQKPRVDHNGHKVRENTPPDEAALAAIDAEITAAAASGDHTRVIALKQAKFYQNHQNR